MKRVTLFSLSTCAACKQVKKFLDDHAVPYTVIEVDTLESGEQWLMTKELAKHNPLATYPTVVIEEVIRGYDIEALSSKVLEEIPKES
ncbi:MAG: glutaredoxin family protein [Thermodesulfovibrionales bacterium]|jgi:glutaredoxin-like protein NrdH